MPNCPRCSKPVYFAERVTSLGKDWHRPCLKCEKCGKVSSTICRLYFIAYEHHNMPSAEVGFRPPFKYVSRCPLCPTLTIFCETIHKLCNICYISYIVGNFSLACLLAWSQIRVKVHYSSGPRRPDQCWPFIFRLWMLVVILSMTRGLTVTNHATLHYLGRRDLGEVVPNHMFIIDCIASLESQEIPLKFLNFP